MPERATSWVIHGNRSRRWRKSTSALRRVSDRLCLRFYRNDPDICHPGASRALAGLQLDAYPLLCELVARNVVPAGQSMPICMGLFPQWKEWVVENKDDR